MRVIRAEALGKDVADTGNFQNRTRRAASDNTRTLRSWTQHDLTCAELANNIVRNGRSLDRHGNHILFGVLNSLTNCLGNLFRLAKTISNISAAVAYYNEGREAEPTTTFNNLGRTIDVDNAIG